MDRVRGQLHRAGDRRSDRRSGRRAARAVRPAAHLEDDRRHGLHHHRNLDNTVAMTCLLALLLATRLSTGAVLDPVSTPHKVGNFPLAIVASPDGNQLVLLLNGWRQQGIQVIDRASGDVVQTIEETAAFIGLTFSPDGHTLYASGGNDDVIYVYRWEGGRAVADGTIPLRPPKKNPKDA